MCNKEPTEDWNRSKSTNTNDWLEENKHTKIQTSKQKNKNDNSNETSWMIVSR